MARARNIKPGLFKNEVLGTADPLYTLLFEGLWVLADRSGRLEDRPLRIKAEVFPYRELDVSTMIDWLHDHGFIVRYEVEGERFIAILKFQQHQNPHKNESESAIPKPPSRKSDGRRGRSTSEKIGSAPDSAGTTRADSLLLIPDSLLPPEAGRPRDALFDAIADVTGLDPATAGSHIGKVCATLRKATPGYSSEEVRDFGRRFGELCSFAVTNGRVRLPNAGELEKYIGRVRKAKATTAPSDPDHDYQLREALRQKAEREAREKLGKGDDDAAF